MQHDWDENTQSCKQCGTPKSFWEGWGGDCKYITVLPEDPREMVMCLRKRIIEGETDFRLPYSQWCNLYNYLTKQGRWMPRFRGGQGEYFKYDGFPVYLVKNTTGEALQPGKVVSMFDPTKEFCHYCGLEIATSGKGILSVSVDGYSEWPKEYWHNTCRAEFKRNKEAERKAKGWLRRFLEWIW